MSENFFSELDNTIGKEDAFWHDYNLQVSSELLEQFSNNDWRSLQSIALARPLYWQERCAEAIGYLENVNGVNVLIDFLKSPHLSVAAIAASELENMSISLSKDFETRLQDILEHLMSIGSSRCEDLRKLIDHLE